MNLLMLSVDSLRWDAVARTHPHLMATPRFDRIAEVFSYTNRCFSVSTATRPVHQSVFSGLFPFEHGITGQHRRQRRLGIPRLFAALSKAGFRVGAFSEAASILGGVDIGAPVGALPNRAAAGRQQVERWLTSGDGQALFLHYWSTHAPYGAADGRALGETARLVRQGQVEAVQTSYREAVRECFEDKIAPLLERLDLGTWTVVLFGDHGERWAEEELYHGRTLHHDVLRVPLFFHVPYTNASPRGSICSLIDLSATLRTLFGLSRVEGYGRDLLAEPDGPIRYLAQIEPTPDREATDDIHMSTVGSTPAFDDTDEGDMTGVIAVYDAQHKATRNRPRSPWQWTSPFDAAQRPVLPPDLGFDPDQALQAWVRESSFVDHGLEDGIDADILHQRLRDLGYLG